MNKSNREPRLAVDKETAVRHAKLTVRRAWAGAIEDFEGWGGLEVDESRCLPIYDLNGKLLFYEFDVTDGNEMKGSVKAAASKIIGSPVVTVEFGARGWDADKAFEGAKKKVAEIIPDGKIVGKGDLVCYSYPKIGIGVTVHAPETGEQELLFDVSDLSLVGGSGMQGYEMEGYGADELEGFTAWSFYEEEAEPKAVENETRWNLAESDLEAASVGSPRVFEGGLTEGDLETLRVELTPQPVLGRRFPFYSKRTIKFAPRCTPHDCFALYGQQTNVYCAVATGQMILDFYRYYFTQDEIAKAMSTGASGTSNPNQVIGYETLSNGCLDATFDGSAQWSEARAEIDANRPLKSGIPGHARACAGWKRQNITFRGQRPRRWLRIFDPWPWNSDICKGGKILWEDWDAVTHTNFIYVRHNPNP